MRHLRIVPYWLRYFLVVVLVVGILFRFTNLNAKVFWHDETFTMLRVSGYTTSEVRQRVFNGQVISPDQLFRFQTIDFATNKGLEDTINSLALEDPQHPPLYYIIARFWVTIFGSSVTAIRCLSAVISLLVFPCSYWLCWELFKVPLGVSTIAITLMATSPIHFVYTQEAREYILWIVTILLSSAALLRAIRLESQSQRVKSPVFNWGIYTLTLAMSLYTFLLSGFVAIAHTVYVITINKFRWNRTVESFIIALLVAFLFFSPWLVILISNFSNFNATTAWTTRTLPLGELIKSWLLQVTRIFFDLDWNLNNIFQYLTTLFFLGFVGYSIYFLQLTTNLKVWLFIVTLIFIPALPLVLPDLIFGGMRSVSERYFLPSYLGIQIAIAYLFSYNLNNGIISRRQIWQIIIVSIISLGIISIAVNSQSTTWWNKVVSYGNPQVATLINQSSRPLLISDDANINYGNIFSLGYLLEPQVRLLLLKEGAIVPRVNNKYKNIFLLNPSNKFREEIEGRYRLRTRTVYRDNYYSLLKLER